MTIPTDSHGARDANGGAVSDAREVFGSEATEGQKGASRLSLGEDRSGTTDGSPTRTGDG